MSYSLDHIRMKIFWSAILVLVAIEHIEVQGALNPLNPITKTRTNRAVKCAQLVSVDGGFFFNPGRGGAFPIPGTKGKLLIPGCLEIVYDSKERRVVRAFEDLRLADLENTISSQPKDENLGAEIFVGSKYEIVDI